MIFYLFLIFWFVSKTKIALFYIYLWQLKEYQVRRFLDHFRTAKGKKLIFKKLNLAKIFLIIIFPFSGVLFFYLLLLLYLLESLKALLDVFQKRLKRPVLTKKTIVLISAAIFLEILFLLFLFLKTETILWFSFWILVFDILAPVIFSLVVLAFQPLTVLLRNQIIKKAKRKREQFSARGGLVIGITGSYGKTSTKEILAEILSEKFNVLKTKEHQNSEVGISQCILDGLKPEHQVFIVEMGAYGRGGIKLLSNIAKPKIGILTGINEQHLALFGSQEEIIDTKFELIESLPQDGTAIFNGNDKYCLKLYEKTNIFSKKLSSFDVWAEDIQLEKEFILFKIRSKDGDFANFRVNLLGKQNIENILLAACCAKELGMRLAEISRACLRIKPEQGAMRVLKKNGLTILDASYSANPKGVIADLDYLKIYQGKKVIVMPCLIELGKVSKEVHRRIGRKIGEVCDLAIITTKERFKDIKEGAGQSAEVLFLEKPREIIDKIKEFYRPTEVFTTAGGPEDVVLLEGRVPGEVIELLR